MNNNSNIHEEYFKWLYGLIKGDRPGYMKLCGELHRKEFTWHVPNDDNRLSEGLELRGVFLQMYSTTDRNAIRDFLRLKCSIFEMMVALSQRIYFQMDQIGSKKDQTPRWFHEMIKNLRLDDFRDAGTWNPNTRFNPVEEAEIDGILQVLVDRTYDFYGNGSLFPLRKYPPQDMTVVEIWYQLMLYLDENYG